MGVLADLIMSSVNRLRHTIASQGGAADARSFKQNREASKSLARACRTLACT
jgi:hypothetical protein